MNSIAGLTGSHLQTYNTIFQHPITHNLEWRKVHSLLGHLGTVTTEPNGHLKVVLNGHTLVLHASPKKDVSEMSEVMELRHFLQRSSQRPAAPPVRGVQWLLLIDHRKARIFRCAVESPGGEASPPETPAEFFRYPPDSKEFSRGKEKPDQSSFFGLIGNALRPPGQVLVFGHGTGSSSEMDEFLAWAKERRPILSSQVVGAEVVDFQHMTDGEILAKARGILGAPPSAAMSARS